MFQNPLPETIGVLYLKRLPCLMCCSGGTPSRPSGVQERGLGNGITEAFRCFDDICNGDPSRQVCFVSLVHCIQADDNPDKVARYRIRWQT